MSLLAIDPGTTESAYVVFEPYGRKAVGFGYALNDEVLKIIETNHYEEAVDIFIEEVRCYGMAVGRDVFETVKWTGRFAQAAIDSGHRVHWIGRKEVLMHLNGRTTASKAEVYAGLRDWFGVTEKQAKGTVLHPGPMYGMNVHIRDALALAILASEKLKKAA